MTVPFTGKLSLSKTAYDTEGYDLGIIETYQASKSVNLDPFEYPDYDAREQEYFDMAGSAKNISISGSYVPVDGSWATLINWKETLEAFVNGYTFDSGVNIYLAIYMKDFYGAGNHLWLERFEAPLLEQSNAGVNAINAYTPKPPMNSITNRPICVTLENLSIELKGGESPNATYQLTLVQRLEV